MNNVEKDLWMSSLRVMNMLGAMLVVHLKQGFFLPVGIECALTLCAANIAIVLSGPGEAFVTKLFLKRTP